MIIDNLTIAAIITTLLVSLFVLGTRSCTGCSSESGLGSSAAKKMKPKRRG